MRLPTLVQARSLMQMQRPLRILVHHICLQRPSQSRFISNMYCSTHNRHRRHHLQQIRRQPLKQPFHALILDRLFRDVHNTRIRPRMPRRALALQPRPEQIERVHRTRADSSTKTSHQREREVARQCILFMLEALELHIPRNHFPLQRLEHKEVDGGVGEHADQSHRQSSVKRSQPIPAPHLLRRVHDQLVPVLAACDSLALHAELERVERVDDGLGDHAGKTSGDELRDGGDLLRVVVAFEAGDGAFGGFVGAEFDGGFGHDFYYVDAVACEEYVSSMLLMQHLAFGRSSTHQQTDF